MAGSQDLSGASPRLTFGPDALALFTVSLDCQEMSWSIPLVLRGDQSHWFKRSRAYSASLSTDVIGNFPVSSQNTLVNWLTDSSPGFFLTIIFNSFVFFLFACLFHLLSSEPDSWWPTSRISKEFKKKKKNLTNFNLLKYIIFSFQANAVLASLTHTAVQGGQEVPSLGSQGSSSPEAWIDDCLFACSLGTEGTGVLCSSDWPQPSSKPPVSAS